LKFGVNEKKADILSSIYAENSLVGVPSHGLNIFVNTCERIRKGIVHAQAEPECVGAIGGFERWDGKMGLGPYNAYCCATRAVELAKTNGIGCVSIRNTNHWGRAGKYSALMAQAGMIGICMTNGTSCMATWGGTTSRIGNNPVSMAVPADEGIVAVDMAFSQFSNGQLNNYKSADKTLPVMGGYDKDGNLTNDPSAILETKKMVPAGFWKGAAFATLTDLVVTCASLGNNTKKLDEIGADMSISQMYLAINFAALGEVETARGLCSETLAYIKDTELAPGVESVRFPGEALIKNKKENLESGIPVREDMWERLLAM
ncbi:MAG: Ldh family oxidoreductase, partial [Ruthenibacterium sp.]